MSNDSFTKPLAEAGIQFPERRAAPRHKMSAPVEMVDPISKTRVVGQMSEISVKGCYVLARETFAKNTVVQLRIIRDTGAFETWARIASVRPEIGMGIVYLELESAHKAVLESWIGELVGNVKQPG